MVDQTITLPYEWAPRPHQKAVWDYMMQEGVKNQRACLVWHRRAGKDAVCINVMAAKAHIDIGLYYYFAPTQKQARKVIWDNIDSNGKRPIDQAFPHALRKSTNDQEMRIVLKCGSIIQVLGSDNYDSVVGSNPRGMVFSEWAIAAKPEAWGYFSPILAAMDNQGWAMFPYTPRGLNHGHSLYRMAERNKKWYSELLTIDDTKRGDGSPVISVEFVEQERDEGKKEVVIQQEYYCKFSESNEKQVFHMESVLEAMSRDVPHDDPGAATICGIDCARFGDDSSIIATRIGFDFKSIPLVILPGRIDTLNLAARIQQHWIKYKPDVMFVDTTGQGIGVSDELKRRRVPHIGINFQGKDDKKEVYANIRCGMMSRFAEWCTEPEASLYNSDDLRNEIAVTEYDEDPDPHGRLKIIKKSEIKLRLEGHSPDELDACMLTFARTVMRRDVKAIVNRNGRRKAIMDD